MTTIRYPEHCLNDSIWLMTLVKMITRREYQSAEINNELLSVVIVNFLVRE